MNSLTKSDRKSVLTLLSLKRPVWEMRSLLQTASMLNVTDTMSETVHYDIRIRNDSLTSMRKLIYFHTNASFLHKLAEMLYGYNYFQQWYTILNSFG